MRYLEARYSPFYVTRRHSVRRSSGSYAQAIMIPPSIPALSLASCSLYRPTSRQCSRGLAVKRLLNKADGDSPSVSLLVQQATTTIVIPPHIDVKLSPAHNSEFRAVPYSFRLRFIASLSGYLYKRWLTSPAPEMRSQEYFETTASPTMISDNCHTCSLQ
jgi:hypothetical protein